MVDKIGDFEDLDYFFSDISKAYRNNEFSDVSFILSDGVTIETNRWMLALRSQYFATRFLFHGEGHSEKVVMECDSTIFRLLLDYIWEGKVTFSHLELQQILELLENARLMSLERLVVSIQDYLSTLLDSGEVDLGEYETLLDFCVDHRFEKLLNSVLKNFNLCSPKPNISKLTVDAIFTLLENKNKAVEEVDIFNFLDHWIKNQPSPVAATTKTYLLALVDLVAIDQEDLVRFVRGSGLYEDKDICDALEKQLNIEQDQTEEDQLDEVFLSETRKDNRSLVSLDEEEIASKSKDHPEEEEEPSAPLQRKKTLIGRWRNRISVSRAKSIRTMIS